MREGPHPLLVYLGMASANAKELQNFTSQGTVAYSQEQLVAMVTGIKKYQNHAHAPKRMELKKIWQSGETKILAPANGMCMHKQKGAAPLLLIPSLVNKAHIFDLTKERSLLRWLNESGIPAYLLDWGDLSDCWDISTAQFIQSKLAHAIEALTKEVKGTIDVLGYCMGGTLLAGSMHIVREHVRKAVFLATPWDFHGSIAEKEKDIPESAAQELSEMVRNWAPVILPTIEKKGYLPKEYTQSLFAALGARGAVSKFIKFVSMQPERQDTQLFVATEDWLNDGLDLPACIARECIKNWFLENEPGRGQWYIDNECINPEKFGIPSLVIAAHKDTLVPCANAYALYNQLSPYKRSLIMPETGHVGLIVGKNAIQDVWAPLRTWLCTGEV